MRTLITHEKPLLLYEKGLFVKVYKLDEQAYRLSNTLCPNLNEAIDAPTKDTLLHAKSIAQDG